MWVSICKLGQRSIQSSCLDALEAAVADVVEAAGEVEGEVEEEDEAQVVEVNQAYLEAAAWTILLHELQLVVVLDPQTHQHMKGLVSSVK